MAELRPHHVSLRLVAIVASAMIALALVGAGVRLGTTAGHVAPDRSPARRLAQPAAAVVRSDRPDLSPAGQLANVVLGGDVSVLDIATPSSGGTGNTGAGGSTAAPSPRPTDGGTSPTPAPAPAPVPDPADVLGPLDPILGPILPPGILGEGVTAPANASVVANIVSVVEGVLSGVEVPAVGTDVSLGL